MTEPTHAVSRSIICNHNQKVQECAECNSLLPSSLWSRMTWRRFEPEQGTYHVTALTGCLARSYFDRISTIEESVESAWAKLRGSLLHYVGRSLGWNELRVKMTFELDGRTITIVGHVDAYDPDTATVYDLKTTRFVKWQDEKGFLPRENHIAQLHCYYTMLDLYGVPVNRLVLVYVDDKTILPKEVPIGHRRQWMIQRATALHRALEHSAMPEPETGSECVYCPFIELCPKSDEAYRIKESKNVRR